MVRIEAGGTDAGAAVDAVVALVRNGFGEKRPEHVEELGPEPFDKLPARPGARTPVGVSPGRVVGPALQMPDIVTEPDPTARLPEEARVAAAERLRSAADDVAHQLHSRVAAAGAVGELIEATGVMATDPDLIADASWRIRDGGLTPERAIWQSVEAAADRLRAAGPRQAERAADLYDVRNRIVAALIGQVAPSVPDPGHPFVLIAADLGPAEASGLDATRCIAMVTEQGGPTSHSAIIARSLGIPAVVGARHASRIPNGTLLLVDGTTGELIMDPSRDQQATAVQHNPAARLVAPGGTADGRRVALLANIASVDDVSAALEHGAEGVGLYRTELCFLGRAEAPSVAEQVSAYRAVFSAFGGRPVVVRTLDAGADKRLAFLEPAEERNPALGVRGFRTAAIHPAVLHDQLEAIKKAAESEMAEVRVMAPMITTVDEVRSFAEAAHAAALPIVGVMIETPAAALQADQILAEVDFVSIGTNDLAQYTFAADRQSAGLATLNDPWQPALLRMIEIVAVAATSNGKPVGVCGEAAADPMLALVLTGLGISSLSMAPRMLAAVGRSLAAATFEVCQRAARTACDSDSPASARRAVRAILDG